MATAATTDDHVIEYEDYIDQQIARTSFHVKSLDLVTGSIVLGLVVLGSLFALVLVDHWVVGLGFGARVGSLTVVAGASVFVLVTRVLPALIRSINPEYSAQVVERSFPNLENGLTSFLFFRRQRESIRESIYAGIQRQAAEGLAEVPIDSAVDRSAIIKLGYAMVALTTVSCAYILFSPKDPLQTLMRIAAPWQDIARPARVNILTVSPGNVQLFRGQTVDIKAEIQGLRKGDMPSIAYSTLDGQVLNRRLAMSLDGVDTHFVGVLTTSESGIQQDLEYRIVAGDAVSRSYEVLTSEAPHIVVERVSYNFPEYTGLQDEVAEGEGDIRAIEGTRVTVFGRANQPIRGGHIELLAALADPGDIATAGPPKQAALIVNDQEAKVRFSLRMGPNRQRSIYRAYRLHFVNENALASVDPIEYSIEVTRDLRPIVEILTPSKRTLEVPENGSQKITVRAVDPDFQLTKVDLSARTRGRPLFRKELLAETQQGQFTSTFNFVPSEYDLKNGDVVEYLAAAEDNRHSPLQGKLDPNRTVSSKQYFRIVEADPLGQEEPPGREDAERPDPERPKDGRAEDPSEQQGDGGKDAGEEGQEGDASEQQTPSGTEERQDKGDTEDSQEGQQGSDAGLQQSGKNGGEAKQQELDSGEPGESQSNSPDSRQGSDGNREFGGSDRDSGSDPKSDPGDPAGSDGDGSDPDPLPSSGERDGEVIDRIRQHMEDKGELERSPEQPDGGAAAEQRDAGQGESSPNNDAAGTDSAQKRDATDSTDETDPKQSSQSPDPPKSNDDAAGDSESRTAPPDAGEKSTDSKQPTGSQERGAETDGSKNDGTSSEQAKDGKPSDQPGAPGEKGDRHTDAADQADEPGPSPPDGKQSPENRDGKPTPAEQDANSERSSNDNLNNQDAQQDSGQEKPGAEQGTGEKQQGSDQQGGDSGNSEGAPGESGEQEVGKQGSGEQTTGQDGSGDKTSTGNRKPEGQSGNADSSNSSKGSDAKSSENQSSQSSQGNSTEGKGSPGTQSDQGNAGDNGEGLPDGGVTGDEANLEYKQKVTDLVLEYLRDQERTPAPDLLDKLGWEQEDVKRFLRRWDELKTKAQGEGTAATDAKRQLDDVLRNMKLDPHRPGVRRAGENNDRQRNSRNIGRRTKVPTDLLDPFRAFQRSLQRSR